MFASATLQNSTAESLYFSSFPMNSTTPPSRSRENLGSPKRFSRKRPIFDAKWSKTRDRQTFCNLTYFQISSARPLRGAIFSRNTVFLAYERCGVACGRWCDVLRCAVACAVRGCAELCWGVLWPVLCGGVPSCAEVCCGLCCAVVCCGVGWTGGCMPRAWRCARKTRTPT